MPYCKKCNDYFPIKIKIDGKTKNLCNRKYCFKCSPFGLHNTSKLEKINGNLDCSGNLICICNYCSREFVYSKSSGHGKTKCNGCTTRERRKRVKLKAIKYKGGKCIKCGYNKSSWALDFHHKDPSQKDHNVAGESFGNISWERTKKELDKCVLVCSNCHREIHEQISLSKYRVNLASR